MKRWILVALAVGLLIVSAVSAAEPANSKENPDIPPEPEIIEIVPVDPDDPPDDPEIEIPEDNPPEVEDIIEDLFPDPKPPVEYLSTIEDYETPLGLGSTIMHVGICIE